MTVKWVTIENRRRARVGDEADGVGEWEAGGVGAVLRPLSRDPRPSPRWKGVVL